MFNEIEKDEALAMDASPEEGDSSAGGGSDRSAKKSADAYGSDDEQNNELLQRIGQKILNILNSDFKATVPIPMPKAGVQLIKKEKPSSKASSKKNVLGNSKNIL